MGEREVIGVRITVRRGPDEAPEVLEYTSARVISQMDGDLTVVVPGQPVTHRYRAGEWAGYSYDLLFRGDPTAR